MKEFNIKTHKYIEIYDNIHSKLFTVILDSDEYEIGLLSKTKPYEYTLTIKIKDNL